MQASPEGLERYQDDRFGMFVHRGLYSLIGAYEQLVHRFDAAKFDADQLARAAADVDANGWVLTSSDGQRSVRGMTGMTSHGGRTPTHLQRTDKGRIRLPGLTAYVEARSSSDGARGAPAIVRVHRKKPKAEMEQPTDEN